MQKKKQRIIFHTTAFSEKYREMYKNYTLPSINGDIKRLNEEGYDCVLSQGCFDLKEAPEKFDTTKAWNKMSALLLQHLRRTVQDAIDQDAYVFLAPPDTIFAQGTVYNCIKAMEGKNVCIAFPHLRAVEKEEWKNTRPTSRELVARCFDSPHEAFTNTFDNVDKNASWAGISTRKITDKLHLIVHSMPTVYAAKFTPQDLRYWEYCMDYGNWDRGWLKLLWRQDRVKVIGSSDAAFCVELTDADKNVPPNDKGMLHNDKYWQEDDFNQALRHFEFALIRD